jgi:hypothetical protein
MGRGVDGKLPLSYPPNSLRVDVDKEGEDGEDVFGCFVPAFFFDSQDGKGEEEEGKDTGEIEVAVISGH